MVDFGCARTYKQLLSDSESVCPKGRWPMVINCDTHGFGDCITAAWLAEGAKQARVPVVHNAAGEKAQLLRLLGQEVVEHTGSMIMLHATYTNDQHVLRDSTTGRLESWVRSLQLRVAPTRPPVLLEQHHHDSVRGFTTTPYVLLCPQSVRANREWPPVYWHELAAALRFTGRTVWMLCRRSREFSQDQGYIDGMSWPQVAALMSRASVVVGNDSAPMHMAGLLDVPGIALLGPTTCNVFAHLASVRCISVDRSMMPCVGCWFHAGYEHYPCATACVAMSCISVDQVLHAIEGVL